MNVHAMRVALGAYHWAKAAGDSDGSQYYWLAYVALFNAAVAAGCRFEHVDYGD
jgi:hypothetical protein